MGTPIQTWQDKTQHLWRLLTGWAKKNGNYKKGTYGFRAEFYEKMECNKKWYAFFRQFQNGELMLFKLNYGVITILSKKKREHGAYPTIQSNLTTQCDF
jgi:hypothetical protein